MPLNREGGPFNDICSRSGGLYYISTQSLVTLIKNPRRKMEGETVGGCNRGYYE